jgi:hypothetical protein
VAASKVGTWARAFIIARLQQNEALHTTLATSGLRA